MRTPSNGLLFEHIGPQDAAIPPFVIEVGPPAESAQLIVFVTPETYAAVVALVIRAGGPSEQHPRPRGTFQVTSFSAGKQDRSVVIYPDVVLSVISHLRKALNAQMPEVLVILERLLAPSALPASRQKCFRTES